MGNFRFNSATCDKDLCSRKGSVATSVLRLCMMFCS